MVVGQLEENNMETRDQKNLTERIERLERLVAFLGGISLNPKFTDSDLDTLWEEVSVLFSEKFPEVRNDP